MKKYLLVILPIAALLAGCLGDTIDGRQIVQRSIFPPQQIYYKCIGTNDLEIRWNPPTVDTQRNFKGYFVVLYDSKPFFSPGSDGIDSTFDTIDSHHVPKTDTMCTFSNNKITLGQRYTVKIWGEQVTDTSVKPDSTVHSIGYAGLSFDFDPREVKVPDSIFASSNGQNGVNLFWSKSSSEGNIGMYGYIIRYKDPDNNSSHLTYLLRTTTLDSALVKAKRTILVTTPPNPQPPVEKRYQFWIKAIRKDSVESADSIGIIWSGAEFVPPGAIPVKIDTGLFFGAAGFINNMVQVDPGGPNAYVQIMHSGTDIVISGKNGTQFSAQKDKDSGLYFNRNYFANPFSNSDFNQSSINFPAVGKDFENTMIYALFPGGSRARILFLSSQDSVTHVKGYIRSDNTIEVQASFQPIEPTQLPFF